MLESLASTLFALSLFPAASPSTAPSAPEWDHDYGRARAHARSMQRPLLVIVANRRDMQHRVQPVRLPQESSAGASAGLLGAYKLCHVDASTEYGQKVAQAFGARKLPYMAILDKTGQKIIYQHAGPLTDAQWQTALATHKRGELPQAALVSQPVPVSYSYFQQPVGFYDPSYCPSCQRGW